VLYSPSYIFVLYYRAIFSILYISAILPCYILHPIYSCYITVLYYPSHIFVLYYLRQLRHRPRWQVIICNIKWVRKPTGSRQVQIGNETRRWTCLKTSSSPYRNTNRQVDKLNNIHCKSICKLHCKRICHQSSCSNTSSYPSWHTQPEKWFTIRFHIYNMILNLEFNVNERRIFIIIQQGVSKKNTPSIKGLICLLLVLLKLLMFTLVT